MYRRLILAMIGVLLVGLAGLISNDQIERALVSDPARSLSWGPTLFRALLAFHGIVLALAAIAWKRVSLPGATPAAPEIAGSEPGGREGGRLSWFILIGLSVLALALRLWQLDTDLWHDEVGTLLEFARPPLGDILTRFPNQNNHLLYSVLAYFSLQIFGESAWALRLPAVLFGVGSLWALFLLGRRIIGARETLFACALMTVSYHHIWFSQNARGYMGLLFFTLLATWLWLESLSRNTLRWWLGYSLAVSLGLMVHMTMAFVVAAHGLLYLVLLVGSKWRRQPLVAGGLEAASGWRPIIAWLLCVSLTLQAYALLFPEFLTKGLHETSLPSEWTNPLWVITESFRNLKLGFSGAAVIFLGGAFVATGWFSILRRNFRAGLLMALPAALTGVTMLALGHNLWPRFFFFSMGFALLIVVHGAMVIPPLIAAQSGFLRPRKRLAEAVGIALTCLLIVASLVTVPKNYRLPKQDFTGARDYVERLRRPEDVVVAVGLAGVDYGRYFAPHWTVANTHEELDTIGKDHSTVWVVYTLPVQLKAWHPEIWSRIESEFEVVKVFYGTLGGGEVYVCRQRPRIEVSKH
jgi:hypothetical protein